MASLYWSNTLICYDPGTASEEESDAEHLEDVLGKQKNEPSKSDHEKRTDKVS